MIAVNSSILGGCFTFVQSPFSCLSGTRCKPCQRYLQVVASAVTLLGCLILVSPTNVQAQARTWRDSSGKTIRATYVRVEGENVVMRFGKRVIRVPLTNLSQRDQDWVNERTGKVGSKTGAGSSQAGDSGDLPSSVQVGGGRGDTQLDSVRTWTDRSGNTMNAKLVRVLDAQIVLKQGLKVKKFSFTQFSDADQAVVKEHLRKTKGEAAVAALDRAIEQEKALKEAMARAQHGRSPNSPNSPTAPRPQRTPNDSAANSTRCSQFSLNTPTDRRHAQANDPRSNFCGSRSQSGDSVHTNFSTIKFYQQSNRVFGIAAFVLLVASVEYSPPPAPHT